MVSIIINYYSLAPFKNIHGFTYGVDVPADYNAFNVRNTKKGYFFDLKTPKGVYQDILFNQLGKHNIANAICAIAMADQAGTSTP